MSELHYVDTHCHLMGEEFQEDLEEVIARCKEKHVDKLQKNLQFIEWVNRKFKISIGGQKYTVCHFKKFKIIS